MSLYRKLFIAAAIVGTGLGVAVLLGEPGRVKQALLTSQPAVPSARSSERPTESATSDVWAANNVRLVPESAATTLPMPSPTEPTTSAPNQNLATLNGGTWPTAALSDSATQTTNTRSGPSPAPISSELPARARLRSESPRPVGNEPRSPATIRRRTLGELEANAAEPMNATHQAAGDWNLQTPMPAGLQAEDNTTRAMNAACPKPSETWQPDAAPPPRPFYDVGEHQRSHIVIDGDSLERLANRYLDDPRRSREIYELNRERLSSPDLLPIGVELKIPPRSVATSWDRSGNE